MSKVPDDHQKHKETLFSEAVVGVRPLQQDKIIPSSEKNKVFVVRDDSIDKENMFDGLSDHYDPFETQQQIDDVNYHHQSISKRQFKTLKNANFTAEDTLDLHGCNRQQARVELLNFLQHCEQNNYRRLVILPGQGLGILRRSLNIWLRQLPKVLAFAESPQRLGGKGAIRVLLSNANK